MYAGIHRISATSRKRTRKDATNVRPTRPDDDITNWVIVCDLPSNAGSPLDLEHLPKLPTLRSVVGVGRHHVTHVRPPAPAHIRRGHRVPPRFVIDLDVAEEVARGFVEVDRVGVDAMRDEHVL